MMKTHRYKGCMVTKDRFANEKLIGCNGVNRYRKTAWRVTFPDKTFVWVGTVDDAFRYIDANVEKHLA